MNPFPASISGEGPANATNLVASGHDSHSLSPKHTFSEQGDLFVCLIEQMQEGVIVLDHQGRRIVFNRKAEELLGSWPTQIPPEQWQAEVGLFLADGVTPCHLDRNPIALAMQGISVPKFELCINNPSRGLHKWFTGSSTPLKDEQGGMLGCVTVFRDATPERLAELALRAEQNRYDLLVAGSAVGMWDWDLVNSELYISDRWCQLLGYEPGELENHFATWYNLLHPADIARFMESLQRHLELRTPYNLEVRLRTKVGRYKWFRSSGQAVWDNHGTPLRMAGSIEDVTSYIEVEEELLRAKHILEQRVHERTAEIEAVNKRLTQELSERKRMQSERQALLRAMSEAEEEQRRHIAREIHDELGQLVVGLKLGIQAAQAMCIVPGALTETLQRLSNIAEEISLSAHNVASQLRPTAIDDHGLLPALIHYWEQWSRQTGIHIDWEVSEVNHFEFPAVMKSTIYRSMQESLTNIMKHAQATHVSVVIERRSDNVVVIVEDNGCGFNAADWSILSANRLGLRGMRERVELAGGEFEIESSPGEGTAIIFRLPIEHHEEGT